MKFFIGSALSIDEAFNVKGETLERSSPFLVVVLVAVLAACFLTMAPTTSHAETKTPRSSAEWDASTWVGLSAVGGVTYAGSAVASTFIIFKALEPDCSGEAFLCGLGEGVIASGLSFLVIAPVASSAIVYWVGEDLRYRGSYGAAWGGAAIGVASSFVLGFVVGQISEGAGLGTFFVSLPVTAGLGGAIGYKLSLREPVSRKRSGLEGLPAPAMVGYTPSLGVHLGLPVPQVGLLDHKPVYVMPLFGGSL